jgi:tRNA 2-thiouridine synthesizing protein A
MADQFIDALGDFCPVPVMKVEAAMKRSQSGDRIILITDHSCTTVVLREEMGRKQWPITVVEVDNGIWEITITKVG